VRVRVRVRVCVSASSAMCAYIGALSYFEYILVQANASRLQ